MADECSYNSDATSAADGHCQFYMHEARSRTDMAICELLVVILVCSYVANRTQGAACVCGWAWRICELVLRRSSSVRYFSVFCFAVCLSLSATERADGVGGEAEREASVGRALHLLPPCGVHGHCGMCAACVTHSTVAAQATGLDHHQHRYTQTCALLGLAWPVGTAAQEMMVNC